MKSFHTPPYPSTHNLGTNRMSDNPRDGVVNKHGQSHDIANLFVSDGSQFTTGGAEKSRRDVMADQSRKKGLKRGRTGLYKPMARSRVTNGRDLLPNIDHRTLWVRRFRDVLALHLSDLGGEESASEAEKAIVRRAACLIAFAFQTALMRACSLRCLIWL